MYQKYDPFFFEDYVIGETLITDKRIVTREDIAQFADLTGDHNPLHTDEEFAKKTVHGGIIAHGAFTFSVTVGLVNSMGCFNGTVIGFLGPSFDLKKPVKPGDEIYAEIEAIDKHASKKPDRGVVTFRVDTLNQRGEKVIEGVWKVMFRTKGN